MTLEKARKILINLTNDDYKIDDVEREALNLVLKMTGTPTIQVLTSEGSYNVLASGK